MLIAGAKRHAKEILLIMSHESITDGLCFFDDVSLESERLLYGKFKILNALDLAKKYFEDIDSRFVLGLGNPKLRKILSDKLVLQGGTLTSIAAKNALIGDYNVALGEGLNIMSNVMISNDVSIGKGSLINAFASIHHDVVVGNFCEVSPHAVLLGGVEVGSYTSIGANATVLPNIKIGSNVVVGAGAVVTTDLPDNSLAVGVPARIVKKY